MNDVTKAGYARNPQGRKIFRPYPRESPNKVKLSAAYNVCQKFYMTQKEISQTVSAESGDLMFKAQL